MNQPRADQIHYGKDALLKLNHFAAEKSYSSISIIVDSNTAVCLPRLLPAITFSGSPDIIEIPTGERSKSLGQLEIILSRLLNANADRNHLIINLGGGMVCDIGGFAATVYMRGIDFINIPTSLLAMVDASVGGKNGINFQNRKNLVGTFNEPLAVLINTEFLETLPAREFRSGFAEVFKHVLLSDERMFSELKSVKPDSLKGEKLETLIRHSVNFKAGIVKDDFRDEGRRRMLNFGHTIGHALESVAMDEGSHLMHGEAVAAGMAGELFISARCAGLRESEMYEATEYLRKIFFDVRLDFSVDACIEFMKSDKKNEAGKIGFYALEKPGSPTGIIYPPEGIIRESLNFIIEEFCGKPVHD